MSGCHHHIGRRQREIGGHGFTGGKNKGAYWYAPAFRTGSRQEAALFCALRNREMRRDAFFRWITPFFAAFASN